MTDNVDALVEKLEAIAEEAQGLLMARWSPDEVERRAGLLLAEAQAAVLELYDLRLIVDLAPSSQQLP